MANELENIANGLANDLSAFLENTFVDYTKNVSKALSGLQDPSQLISSVRKMYLPLGGNVFQAALVNFVGPGNADDWRVRLSIPFDFFMGSAVLKPLMDAGGLVFPYTPSITIGSTAAYDEQRITHQNFAFNSYQSSSINSIDITAEFYVEDAEQAKYWIAVLHFLRSATKMYTSDTTAGGSPPPILSLNGYGDFVFKNVPVVIKSFSVSLDKECDYITTNPDSGFNINSVASGIGVVSGNDFITGIATTLLADNKSHVPTKSTFSISLLPMYSREAARQFSLQTFVNGGYITGGYS